MKLAESACLPGVGALAQAVRVFAVTPLEILKVYLGEGSVLFCDPRYIGTSVKDPYFLGRTALLEKDYVCFHALAVRRESSARQSQDSVQVAILHKDLEYLACLAFE